jgi:hypothetical protein
LTPAWPRKISAVPRHQGCRVGTDRSHISCFVDQSIKEGPLQKAGLLWCLEELAVCVGSLRGRALLQAGALDKFPILG